MSSQLKVEVLSYLILPENERRSRGRLKKPGVMI